MGAQRKPEGGEGSCPAKRTEADIGHSCIKVLASTWQVVSQVWMVDAGCFMEGLLNTLTDTFIGIIPSHAQEKSWIWSTCTRTGEGKGRCGGT